MTRLLTLTCLLYLLTLQSVHANRAAPKNTSQPAYYLVFTANQLNQPELVFQRSVIMQTLPAGHGPDEFEAAEIRRLAGGDLVSARVLGKDGRILFQKMINMKQDIRAEFPGKGGKQIERHEVRSVNRSFVLRLPTFPDGTLILNNGAVSEFSMAEIAAETARIEATDPSTSFASSAIGSSPANRVDLLIMGDGYSAAQSALFADHVENFNSRFFSISPYTEYRNFVNSTPMFTASAQSGSDHPPYDATCNWWDKTCCADSLAQTDPKAGTFVDTAFDSTFCSSNLHRLVSADSAKIYAAAAASPDWDHIILLVNDDAYGGSGGAIAITTNNESGVSVVQHEVGHSFTRLADEYDSAYPSYPACSDLPEEPGIAACEANVTNETNRAEIKWLPWIDPATPIPTPESSGYESVVGLFQGARYITDTMYRPKDFCQMRALGVDFCAVCKQQYVLNLYQGGWGEPVAGIDLIEPGSEFPAPGSFSSSAPVNFSIEHLEPTTGVSISWSVNGEVQPGEDGSSFQLNAASPAVFTVVVTVTDDTDLVHPDLKPVGVMSSQRTWVVTVESAGNCKVNMVSGVTEYFDTAYEACEILVLGPDFIAADGANIPVNSGWEIMLMPGFIVEQGATLNANVCGQSLCTTSPDPMPIGCHSCVDQICDIDPSCCALEFDEACLDMVSTECGLVCE